MSDNKMKEGKNENDRQVREYLMMRCVEGGGRIRPVYLPTL